MCGRFAQYEGMADYLRELAAEQDVISGYDNVPIARYNIPPSSRVQILHGAEDGIHIDSVHWGWAPFWAKGKRPDPINARVETVTSGKFFKQLWPNGRALVPANGWFEWLADPADPKRKQPCYITSTDGGPLFFAALAEVHHGVAPDERDGFVIITAAADQGLIDIHDRKPLVLTPQLAREWLDPATSAQRAATIIEKGCRPAQDFRWFPVGKAVGNARNEGAELIEPTNDRGRQGDLGF